MPKIWIDADACPKPVKEITFKAAQRLRIQLCLVANHDMSIPRSPFISKVLVGAGFDVADHYIAQHLSPDDLVITADIPLASLVVDAKATALNPRGFLYTEENIKEWLSVRNLMEELRESGTQTGGPPPFSNANKKAFAGALDRYFATHR